MRKGARKLYRDLRHAYDLSRSAGEGRSSSLRYGFYTLYADRFRRGGPLAGDVDALTEADHCPHEDVWRVRTYPRVIERCRRCGVAFATRRDTLEDATARHDDAYFLANRDFLFPDGTPDVFSYAMPRTLFFWALGLNRFRPRNRRALDVGCGIGIMVRYLQFLGFDAEGVEISPWAVEYARRELGLGGVREGTMQGAGYEREAFGLVTLVHVLEHLDDPVPVLREVYRILEPGGLVYLEVPASERDTSDLEIDDHFWFYGPAALHRLLCCVGFRDVNVGEGTFDERLHNVPFVFASARRPGNPASP